jgi:pyridoxamine 5'-phosphate oxidase
MTLSSDVLSTDPIQLLHHRIEEAERLGIVEPKAFVLSTVDLSGKPSSRAVLIKAVDSTGIVFASSELSKKGQDLHQNPMVAGTLWWKEIDQQINFCGHASKLDASISDELFSKRPREARAIAAVSIQSAPLIDEDALREMRDKLVQQPDPIKRPNAWHAYHIAIEAIEFFHFSKVRFHSRLRYDLKNGSWIHHRLQP